jgi:tRNA synthetases class I (W and Y)
MTSSYAAGARATTQTHRCAGRPGDASRTFGSRCSRPRSLFPARSRLIEEHRFFTLHAGRQTGKTTSARWLVEHLDGGGRFHAAWIDRQIAREEPDPAKAQDFGHDVTFVVGTFTAQVGDTSDKATGRPQLSPEQVFAAARTYAEQAFTILDRERTTIAYNHEWLGGLTLSNVVSLASKFTVQQFLIRDNYRRRIEANIPVGLHEFLYALLQGYDAVHLRADVQLGATEQLFNILAGRKLQEAAGQKPCVCITFPILVGLDGKGRMSKSAGNYIALTEPATEQYGK